jgi:hypothetical protein
MAWHEFTRLVGGPRDNRRIFMGRKTLQVHICDKVELDAQGEAHLVIEPDEMHAIVEEYLTRLGEM